MQKLMSLRTILKQLRIEVGRENASVSEYISHSFPVFPPGLSPSNNGNLFFNMASFDFSPPMSHFLHFLIYATLDHFPNKVHLKVCFESGVGQIKSGDGS